MPSSSSLIGAFFIFTFVISAPSITGVMKSSTPVQATIDNALPHAFTVIYLAIVLGVIVLGANVAFTAAVRQLFSMACDGALPASSYLERTRNGTPWIAVVTVAVITGIPFFFSSTFSVLITASTGFFYVIYAVVMLIVLGARLRGWPRETAPSGLRRWGVPVTALAALWALAMTINLPWPRDATNPTFHGIRVAIWLIGVPLVVGLIYYVVAQHRRVRGGEDARVVPVRSLKRRHSSQAIR